MNNPASETRRLEDFPRKELVNFRAGWLDIREGCTWSKDYDAADKTEQHAYEVGRLAAVNVKTAGLDVCEWHLIQTNARAVGLLFLESQRRVGRPFPNYTPARLRA